MSRLVDGILRTSRQKIRDEHERLQGEDFGWLRDIRSALSPYWSSRIVPRSDGREMIVIEGLRKVSR